jgi:hypothetical protein
VPKPSAPALVKQEFSTAAPLSKPEVEPARRQENHRTTNLVVEDDDIEKKCTIYVDLESGSGPDVEAATKEVTPATLRELPVGSILAASRNAHPKPPTVPRNTTVPPGSKNTPPIGKSATMKRTDNPMISALSPITMCFTRMLGAAEFIKTPGTKADEQSVEKSSKNKSVKRKPFANKKILPLNVENLRKRAVATNAAISNPFDEVANDSELERLVILKMAMQRNQTSCNLQHEAIETALAAKQKVNPVISEGFFWREYPECEQVLYNNMPKYYEISAIQRNYKLQQHFNNVLVDQVRQAAEGQGFSIDPEFCDKKLRDRIRCFYKTHLQNAKKRLATLQKHSDSCENQALLAIFIRMSRTEGMTFEEATEAETKESAAVVGRENATLNVLQGNAEELVANKRTKVEQSYDTIDDFFASAV